MAQIDLKKATIKIWDGTSVTGALAANCTSGASVLTVAASDGSKFDVGGWFKFDKADARYLVSAITTDFTGVTFTPALSAAVASTVGLIIGSPNELEVKLGEGNLTYSEKVNREYFRDRGRLDLVRDGDEEPMDVSLDAAWEFLQYNANDPAWPTDSANTASIEEALKKIGACAAWSSTGAACQPYSVDILIIYQPDCGSTLDEYILLREFRYESAEHDLKGGTLAFSGKCNVTQANIYRI